jgi:hypothetical protein
MVPVGAGRAWLPSRSWAHPGGGSSAPPQTPTTPCRQPPARPPDPHFGRILAAYGGVFVAASLAWGVIFDGFRPDIWDLVGAGICLAGVAVIMYPPRAA